MKPRLKRDERLRRLLLALAVVRIAISALAIPLAPFLYRKHFVILVLMRPTKDVLLLGGFLLRLRKVSVFSLVAASVPLAIFGVWQAYFLGRFHASQIRSGKMPRLAKRVLKPHRVREMQKLLKKKGTKLVVLGRLAVFPSALVGAAAGSGDVPASDFMPADTVGGLLSIFEAVGTGWLLGSAYKRAGPWITAGGFAAVAAIAVIVARYLKREAPPSRPRKPGRRRRRAARARRGADAPSRS